MPKKIRETGYKVDLSQFENLNLPETCSNSLLELAVLLADELESAVGKRIRFARSEIAGAAIRLVLTGSVKDSENYELNVSRTEIRVEAGSETSLYYGLQTLRQLIRTEGAKSRL